MGVSKALDFYFDDIITAFMSLPENDDSDPRARSLICVSRITVLMRLVELKVATMHRLMKYAQELASDASCYSQLLNMYHKMCTGLALTPLTGTRAMWDLVTTSYEAFMQFYRDEKYTFDYSSSRFATSGLDGLVKRLLVADPQRGTCRAIIDLGFGIDTRMWRTWTYLHSAALLRDVARVRERACDQCT